VVSNAHPAPGLTLYQAIQIRLSSARNGVKALAWESTKKRATPEFFSQHSVTELARQSDYLLEQQGRTMHPMMYDPDSDHYVVSNGRKHSR
jgi:hypothetical protein